MLIYPFAGSITTNDYSKGHPIVGHFHIHIHGPVKPVSPYNLVLINSVIDFVVDFQEGDPTDNIPYPRSLGISPKTRSTSCLAGIVFVADYNVCAGCFERTNAVGSSQP